MNEQNKLLIEALKAFANQASHQDADEKYLELLRRLTGQHTVTDMIQHFQKLANIKPSEVKSAEIKQ